MDVGTVPRAAPEGGFRGRSRTSLKGACDRDLVVEIRSGNEAAFEAVDARYRNAILASCRRLLGDRHEAEDAVQHTFLAAYTSILASEQEIDLQRWLYVIARNRCYSILRGRREVTVAQLESGVSEEPDALLQRREDLRDLVLDVRSLPDDQRAALVMAELGAHTHDEIAGALEVPRAKVKALVFQARASLVATRAARETDCADIRRQLRAGRASGLLRGTVRRHLHDCSACREYRRQLRYQRARFAAALPLGPALALRGLLHRLAVGGRALPAAGGARAAAAVKLGALKPVAGALAAMLSAASAVIAVHSMVRSPLQRSHDVVAVRHPPPARRRMSVHRRVLHTHSTWAGSGVRARHVARGGHRGLARAAGARVPVRVRRFRPVRVTVSHERGAAARVLNGTHRAHRGHARPRRPASPPPPVTGGPGLPVPAPGVPPAAPLEHGGARLSAPPPQFSGARPPGPPARPRGDRPAPGRTGILAHSPMTAPVGARRPASVPRPGRLPPPHRPIAVTPPRRPVAVTPPRRPIAVTPPPRRPITRTPVRLSPAPHPILPPRPVAGASARPRAGAPRSRRR